MLPKIVLKRLCFLALLLLAVNTWARTPLNSVFSPTSEVVGPSVTHSAIHLGSPTDFTAGGLPSRLVYNMSISLDTPKIKGNKLVGMGANGKARQGISVSLSADGKTAIVGGPGDDGGKGAVWIYRNENGLWRQEGNKLVGSGAVGNAYQGISVSLSADGKIAIVGGHEDNEHKGAVWIYRNENGVWRQDGGKLVGSGAVGDASQGFSVSLSADGKIAIVGGPEDNEHKGAAWIYRYVNGGWRQEGNKLVGVDAEVDAQLGRSVSLSADGNTAIVGGPGNGYTFDGAVWIYRYMNGGWRQDGNKLVGTGSAGPAMQGNSVSLSADGNTAIVGGPDHYRIGSTGIGAVWIYRYENEVWRQQGNKLVGSGAIGRARQGVSVSLSADGKTAIVGGLTDNGDKGAAWIYRNVNGVWRQDGGKLFGSGVVGKARLGRSVSISADGKTAIVGGPFDDGEKGAAWVYRYLNGVWKKYQ
jgi:hypothetical protein